MHLGHEYKIKHQRLEGCDTLPEVLETTITIDQVDRIYIGKGNRCRCGCAGDYFNADEHETKIINALRQMESGNYQVRSIENYIFEIITSENKYSTKAKTIYLKKNK